MKAYQMIPDSFHEIAYIDLQKDRRTLKLVALISLAVMILMISAMAVFRPIRALFDLSEGLLIYIVRFLALILGYVLYIILHELTHGCVMRLLGGRSVKFGYNWMYAFAGSEEDYFDKSGYILIALAPLVLWFLVFSVLCSFLTPAWFWVVYLLQVGNVAGSAGDLYVVFRVLSMPDDVLVQDTGVHMTFCSCADRKEKKDEQG